ncbi:MAG: hypothetical protein EXS17_04130 [Phycisphaerales bacterium]|nr:hypothetical protein [Phycisphaerales bacterium]
MDRKRLGNVQQTDLTEGRINDDFLFWLKTSGPNWLLAVLVVACLAMGWNWWQNRAAQARDLAWAELNAADIPSALKDVAAKHGEVDSIASYALLNAGDRYLQSVLSGKRFDREAAAADATMTPELKTEWLAEADALYVDVITAAKADETRGSRGFEIGALFGRAAIAESRGDVAAAKTNLEAVRSVAGDDYPWLSKNAAARLESLGVISTPYPIPAAPVAALPPTIDPATGLAPSALSPDNEALKLLLGDMAKTGAAAPTLTPPAMPAPEPEPTP